MTEIVLPAKAQILHALGETPLGEGDEAIVYKVHMNPKFTVRVSKNITDRRSLMQRILSEDFMLQEDIFEGRNFGQVVAFLGTNDQWDKTKADLTINRYAAGYSLENKDKTLAKDEALLKSRVSSEAVLNMPRNAWNGLVDNAQFLSSKRHSLDVYHGGWCTCLGNILLSTVDNDFSVIDVQPFIYEHPGINMKHTKGYNTPLFLAHGVIPGVLRYEKEHSKDPTLIGLRTEILDEVISACERNGLNDMGGYVGKNMDQLSLIWKVQLSALNIKEKYQEDFIDRLRNIKDEHPYPVIPKLPCLIRVGGSREYD